MILKRALIIGIDDYAFSPLKGCVKDAKALNELLEAHEDGSRNYDTRLVTKRLTRTKLRQHLTELFASSVDVALLYFAGHGMEVKDQGGLLITQDAEDGDEGIFMSEIENLIKNSARRIPEVMIILDCCHAGHMGNSSALNANGVSLVREGVAIMAGSMSDQMAAEEDGHGKFTNIVLEALRGGAADITGRITIAGVYNFADRLLGAYDQRPMFKANFTKMPILRTVEPALPLKTMRKITKYFPHPHYDFPLDKRHEPDEDPQHPDLQAIFRNLQAFCRLGLVTPINEEHMYYAAMNETGCRLTRLGQFYWQLISKKRF